MIPLITITKPHEMTILFLLILEMQPLLMNIIPELSILVNTEPQKLFCNAANGAKFQICGL